MGTMGYALPAAMGARLATTARQVVAVMGDGGFQMSMQELATLCQHDIPVKMAVLRNDCLGWSARFKSRITQSVMKR